jgi:hypothetical protein
MADSPGDDAADREDRPIDEDDASLAAVADWGTAEDWSDWSPPSHASTDRQWGGS